VQYKGPADPVTLADRAANDLICEHLAKLFPGEPIVAEESPPEDYAGFHEADRVFFVDPIDGTLEFIAGNAEYVVMIGVAEIGRAVLGVVHAPVLARSWFGAQDAGAFLAEARAEPKPIVTSSTRALSSAVLVSSRATESSPTRRILRGLGPQRVQSLGSAGLKGASVASGDADVYLAPGMAGSRWDACAIDALVCASGGRFSDAQGAAIDYRASNLDNRDGLLATNGWLHEAVLRRLEASR
jgi:3'(2'), 5'-bisphosphate nucleotidase